MFSRSTGIADVLDMAGEKNLTDLTAIESNVFFWKKLNSVIKQIFYCFCLRLTRGHIINTKYSLDLLDYIMTEYSLQVVVVVVVFLNRFRTVNKCCFSQSFHTVNKNKLGNLIQFMS